MVDKDPYPGLSIRPEVVIQGPYEDMAIMFEEVPSTRNTNARLDAMVKIKAQEHIAAREAAYREEGLEPDAMIYRNDPLYRVEGLKIEENGTLQIQVSVVDFHTHYAARRIIQSGDEEAMALGETFLSSILTVLSVTITSDGSFVFAKLGPGSVRSGQIGYPGSGMCSRREIPLTDGGDLKACIIREYEEEIGVQENVLSISPLIAILRTPTGTYQALYVTHIQMTAEELLLNFQQFQIGDYEKELKHLHIYTLEEAFTHMQSQPDAEQLLPNLITAFLGIR